MIKLTLLITGLVLLLSGDLFAQIQEPIKVEQRFGTVFTQNGKVLKPRHLLKLTQNNPESYKSMQLAQKNNIMSKVVSFTGGFLIGWQLGVFIKTDEPDWKKVGLGAGLVAFSIPFAVNYNKYAKHAVSIYNDSITTAKEDVAQINFGITSSGIGLRVTF